MSPCWTPPVFPCVLLGGYHRLFPATWASAIIPCCQQETCRRGRKEQTLRGSKSVFQSSNPPIQGLQLDANKALLRILLLLSAIRVNRAMLCLCDDVERGIDAPHLSRRPWLRRRRPHRPSVMLSSSTTRTNLPSSVITGPPFFRKKQKE